MLIDWFTVFAQTLNFLLLVWLMKRYLYKPVLQAIDARETRVAGEIAAADSRKAEAQKESDEFRSKNEAFDHERAALLKKTADEAEAEGRRLLDEARKAADSLSARRRAALLNEARHLNAALRLRVGQEVFAIARKTLSDLATTSLEQQMGTVFSSRLKTMEGEAKLTMGEALKAAPDPAVVHCAFDLPSEQQAIIQTALNEAFSAEIRLRFETSPDLICGIELAAGGQKVSWSIADYLAALEKGVGEVLKERDRANEVPGAKEALNRTAPKTGTDSP